MSALPRRVVLQVFVRSLFLQAGFNTEVMQTLGLIYALAPALRHLYPEPAALQEALRRHLTTFNSHPYAAAAIVGGILHAEERVARGEADPETVTHFKTALMGPLAALGDGFFWMSLRPAVGALSVALVPILGAWSALLFVVLYNTVHLSTRAWLFRLGLHHGEGLVPRLTAAHIPQWSKRLRVAAAALVGAMGAWMAVRFGAQAGVGMTPWLVAGALALAVATVALMSRRMHPVVVMYVVALVAVVSAFLVAEKI